MSKLAARFLFFLGLSLWIPGIALINVAGAWGLQIAMLLALTLFMLLIFTILIQEDLARRLAVKREWLIFYGVSLLADLLCTIFSRVGFAKSVQTFGVEVFGVIFGAGVAWWFCRAPKYSSNFLAGFRRGGIVASLYAIYQVLGWHLGLPFTSIPMNNASFSIIDPVTAQYEGRALGACPEPSVLASLLLPLLAIMTVDVFVYGDLRRYAWWIVVCLAFLSSSSQSVALVPICLIGVIIFLRPLLSAQRKFRSSDMIGLGLLGIGAVALLATSDSVFLWLSRIGNSDQNISAAMRYAEILIGLEKFRQSPIFGFGLGSSATDTDVFLSQLNLSRASQGIMSGFFRILSEQGLVGMLVIVTALYCLYFARGKRVFETGQAVWLAYLFSFALGAALGGLFVGYRNLYQLWLIVPIGLCLKYEWRQLALAADLPLRRTAPVLDKGGRELGEGEIAV